jgi:orotidine-5'-phosphate decarboxylase
MTRAARDRLVFALDVPDLSSARRWTSRLAGEVGIFKVGLELFVRAGPDAVAVVRDAGARCFLDLKLHDIPETVSRSVRAAAALGVEFLTVHASGGWAMLAAAVSATGDAAPSTRLLAVTVLTSLDAKGLAEIGLADGIDGAAGRLARLAAGAGIRGLVCSPHEVASMRTAFPDAMLVTPGIRPTGAALGDQSRTATAGEAIRAGADLVVVGRPIRDAGDPSAVVRAIVADIESASA